MKLSLLLIFLVSFFVNSCNNHHKNTKKAKTFISYHELNSIYLLEEQDSIASKYNAYITPLYENTDCLLGLPSISYKGQEFIPVGYLYFNKKRLLVKAEVIFTLGNNPNIDTTGIRSELMKRFDSNKDAHQSYRYGNTTTFKSFIYQIKDKL